MEPADADMCFACGKDNPISLKLDFSLVDEDTAQTYFTPDKLHQGYNEIMHGGLVTTLLDEAMAKVLELNEIIAVTGEMKTRFKKPVSIGQKLQIIGEIKDNYHSLYFTEARLVDEEGEILAEAEAKFMKVKK
jgi:uncharacterized protein (TIGR00369 family)